MLQRLTQLFPLWALLFSIAAYLQPSLFTDLKAAIVPLLGLVMFGMGMTLKADDFLQVLRRPKVIGLGVGLQFLLMPAFAWLLAMALDLPPAIAAGLILVGACPGGTASNVVCYLAKGDVALSITITTVATLLAVVATPALTLFYAGQIVDVPMVKMLISIAKIVLLPVMAGVVVNQLFGRHLNAVKQVFPLISVMAIVLIIAIIVALNQARIEQLAVTVALAVIAHNLLGMTAGYSLARLFGYDERIARTLSIEVGMQNSGLGVALASQYFAPAAALPGAIFSIWHNLSGSLAASFWQQRRSNS